MGKKQGREHRAELTASLPGVADPHVHAVTHMPGVRQTRMPPVLGREGGLGSSTVWAVFVIPHSGLLPSSQCCGKVEAALWLLHGSQQWKENR